MAARTAWVRIWIGISASGLLLASGCLAQLEVNLDRVLAPHAVDNLLALPLSSALPLARFLLATT